VDGGGAGLLVGEGDEVGDEDGDELGDAVGDAVGDDEGEAVGDGEGEPSAQAEGAVNDSDVAASPAATNGTTRTVPGRFMPPLRG
jgi:hypothetical protein